MRQYLLVAGTIGATFTLVGTVATYVWARSQRRKSAAERRGPRTLLILLEVIEARTAARSGQRSDVFGLLFAVLTVATIVNFAVFGLATAYLGGAARWGKVVDGRYFVGSHNHFTEVSPAVFAYSTWHFHSTWISLLVLAVFAGLLEWRARHCKRERDA